ncbi:unnamed protein product, partial [Rotaria sordida]
KYFCIICDFWYEKSTESIHYSGLIIHFIDSQWHLHVFTLACQAYDYETQHVIHIRSFVDKVLEEFGFYLNGNIFIITDNENKMKSAFKDDVKRIECSVHHINIVLQHAFIYDDIQCDAAQLLFTVVRAIVAKVHKYHKQSLLSTVTDGNNQITSSLKKYIGKQLQDYWIVDDVRYIATMLHSNLRSFNYTPQKNIMHNGNIITSSRTRLQTSKINKLLFICRNLSTLRELFPPSIEQIRKRRNSCTSTIPMKKLKHLQGEYDDIINLQVNFANNNFDDKANDGCDNLIMT